MDAEKTVGPRWSVWRVLVVLGLVAGLIAVWTHDDDSSSSYEAGKDVTTPSLRSVEYHLTGDASGADLTWTDGRGQTTQATGKAVPLRDKDGGPDGIRFTAAAGSHLYFSAQNTGSFGDLTCQIVVDGEVVATNTSSGGYAIVTCIAGT